MPNQHSGIDGYLTLHRGSDVFPGLFRVLWSHDIPCDGWDKKKNYAHMLSILFSLFKRKKGAGFSGRALLLVGWTRSRKETS